MSLVASASALTTGATPARAASGPHAGRAPGPARADRPARAAKVPSRFTHALEAARQPELVPGPATESSPRPPKAPGAPADLSLDDPGDQAGRAPATAPGGQLQATPCAWLLLPFGVGTQMSGGDPAAPGNLAADGSPELDNAVLAEAAANGPDADLDSTILTTGAGRTTADALEEPPLELSHVGAADQESLKEGIGKGATQSPELLSRWRAATRASGGDVGNVPRQAGAAVADAVAATGSAAGATSAGAVPVSRAADVLLRLAQADRHGSAGNGPSFHVTPQLATMPAIDLPLTPAAAAVPPPTIADQVVEQVVASLKMQWKDGVGEAKLHLRPDALGAVTVTLRVEHGAVTAVVRAESAQVQEWVLQHQQSLRQQMEAAGLRLEELVVSPDDQREPGHDEDASPESQRRRPRTPDGRRSGADVPTFESLV